MKYDELTSSEHEVIKMFLIMNTSWKDALVAQLHDCIIRREFYGSHYFLFFEISPECIPIHVDREVPIEIFVEHIPLDEVVAVVDTSEELRLCDDLTTPTGLRLYVSNGYLKEIEVFSLGGDLLDLEKISQGRQHYCIYCD